MTLTPEARARISAAAAKVAADAPPLSTEQTNQLRRIFSGSAQRIRERRAQQGGEQKPAA